MTGKRNGGLDKMSAVLVTFVLFAGLTAVAYVLDESEHTQP